jgi:hypothetical protein
MSRPRNAERLLLSGEQPKRGGSFPVKEAPMTYNRPERDEYFQDAGLQPDVRRPVAYGADRHSNGFYGVLIVGATLLLAILIYAFGMFSSPMDKTANNPSIDKLPTTTGQGSQSR